MPERARQGQECSAILGSLATELRQKLSDQSHSAASVKDPRGLGRHLNVKVGYFCTPKSEPDRDYLDSEGKIRCCKKLNNFQGSDSSKTIQFTPCHLAR
jgi:hypothetical protein